MMQPTAHESDWGPFDPAHSEAQVAGVLELIGEPPKTVLDLGCGDGRITLPLLERGYTVVGIDDDPAALRACKMRLGSNPFAERVVLRQGDLVSELRGSNDQAAAVVCLGNTLMTLVRIEQVQDLFDLVCRCLAEPPGIFIIDDFPFEYWAEVAEGNWQEGISEDESMQIVWMPGEPIFALRTGDAVDPECWAIRPDDPLHRLWSRSELDHFAEVAGFQSGRHLESNHLIVFEKG